MARAKSSVGKNIGEGLFEINSSVTTPQAEKEYQIDTDLGCELKKIKLTLIDKNPDNEKIFSMDIDSIKKAIREEDFKGAIEVYKKPDGRYEISSGHRRYEACKALGYNDILCFVFEKPNDDKEVIKRLLTSNTAQRKLTPLDYARMIDTYINKVLDGEGTYVRGNRRKLAAEFLGISYAAVQRYLEILSLHKELQSLCAIENFPYMALKKSKGCTDAEACEIKELILNCENLENIKSMEVSSIVKEVLEGDKAQEKGTIPNMDIKQKNKNKAIKRIQNSFNSCTSNEDKKELLDNLEVIIKELREKIS